MGLVSVAAQPTANVFSAEHELFLSRFGASPGEKCAVAGGKHLDTMSLQIGRLVPPYHRTSAQNAPFFVVVGLIANSSHRCGAASAATRFASARWHRQEQLQFFCGVDA